MADATDRPDPGRNPSTALATVLVDELSRGGVTEAVISPGSRSAPLAMALHADPRIRLHVRLDERSAAFTAIGLGRATGRPAVVVCTSGSAAAHFLPAVLEADVGRVPLLLLTADRPGELRGTGANQTITQPGLYGNSIRWSVDLSAPEARQGQDPYWRSVVARAVAAARATAGPAGPVHLNVGLREPLVPAGGEAAPGSLDGRPGGSPWTRIEAVPRPPTANQVTRLAERLGGTPRGIVVAGGGVGDPVAVVALATRLGWPLLAEPHSGARSGQAAIGAYDRLLRDSTFAAAHRPDVALVVGRVGLSKALLGFLDAATPQILIHPWPDWPDPERTLAAVITASPGLTARAVTARLPASPGDPAWLASWRAADRAVTVAVDAVLDAAPAPTEPRTARDLSAGLPDGATLVVASSMPIRDLDQVLRPRTGLRILANRGTSGVDGFTSTAVGVALASDGPTFALAGDLSLIHDTNGLHVGSSQPDLVLVVVNNDGGGIFSFLPQADFPDAFEELFGTPHGIQPAHLAAAARVGHRLVTRADDLMSEVARAQAAGGIQLVEVRTDRAANLALHTHLQHTAITALAAPR